MNIFYEYRPIFLCHFLTSVQPIEHSLDKCGFQFTWLLVELIAFCCQLNRFYSLITLLLYCTNPNGFPGSLPARQQQWSAVFQFLISPSSLANSFWLLTAADLPDFFREIGTSNRISAFNWKCNKWEKFFEWKSESKREKEIYVEKLMEYKHENVYKTVFSEPLVWCRPEEVHVFCCFDNSNIWQSKWQWLAMILRTNRMQLW